ncbi:MAG: nucleotidyltransferase family protein [Gemmatimonadota bacterium]|nr:nucleotidyltransferase family protein [Gemmatimonadota bacterium]
MRFPSGGHRALGDARSKVNQLLPSEERLLLLTAGGPKNDDAIRSLVEGGIDWTRVMWLAELELATPIVWRRIKSVAGNSVPASVQTAFARNAQIADIRMLSREQRLVDALHALSKAGIPVLLLKGAALASTAYSSALERPMADIDLLVPPNRAVAARAALLESGWQWESDVHADQPYDVHHHLPPLRDARGDTNVEIHTALFFRGHPFRFDDSALWAGAHSVSIGGEKALVPSAVHQLWHIGLHFAWSHEVRFGSWRAFRDTHALIMRYPDALDALVPLARGTRGASVCYWTLRLAQRAAGIDVPASVLSALRPPRREISLGRLERHFLLNLLPAEYGSPSARVDQLLWDLAMCPSSEDHGAVRPWDHSDDFIQARTADGTQPAPPSFATRVANLGTWTRYLRSVVDAARAPVG